MDRRPSEAGRGGEAGYTLVGLLVVVAVVNVALGVAVSSWVTLDKRAKEAELIWRGQQIARAIDCFQQSNAGEPLDKLEKLVEADCLRRVYRDPMVRGGEWRILRQEDLLNGVVAELLGLPLEGLPGQPGQPGQFGQPGQSGQPGQQSSSGGGLAGGFQLGGRSSGGQGGSPFALRLNRPGLSTSTSSGQGIIGVVSTSERTGLRAYRGRDKYSEWVFLSGS